MKTVTSSKLNYCKNGNVTKTVMSLKLKYHQSWIVTKTEVSSKLKCYHTLYLSSKITNLNSRDWHWIPRSCFCIETTPKSWVTFIFHRQGVAGAVLPSPPSLIELLVKQPFLSHLQNIIKPKPWELNSWNFERMYTPHNVSHVRCHVSGVRC